MMKLKAYTLYFPFNHLAHVEGAHKKRKPLVDIVHTVLILHQLYNLTEILSCLYIFNRISIHQP